MEFVKLGNNEHSIRYRVKAPSGWLSFTEVFELWRSDSAFRSFYIQGLTESGFQSFFWEHPGLTSNQTSAPYEFILHESRRLGQLKPDVQPFSEHFKDHAALAEFPNWGRNAVLLAPGPLGEPECYTHFAAFLRSDQIAQKHRLFERLGSLMQEQIQADKPIWLSTAGMRVAWLHVRLGDAPKYFRSKTYQNPDFVQQQSQSHLRPDTRTSPYPTKR